MTPEQKIKHLIINLVAEWDGKKPPGVKVDSVDDIYEELDEDSRSDAESEIREGDVETDITPLDSRHYESNSVAAKCPDGSWVGWTYWFGGGKWGEPESMPWMKDAYELECEEREEVVIVREFHKVERLG